MDRLISKIVAGGLSAGVFLIWWPQHVKGESLFHLGLRGLLWTLSFELILLSVGPLEDRVRAILRRRLDEHRSRVRARVAEALPAPARTGGAVALACLGVAAPVALLAGGPTEVLKPETPPRVVKQVIVEKPVVERKVVVRRVVTPAPPTSALQPQGAAPSVSEAQVTRPRKAAAAGRERTGRRPETGSTAEAEQVPVTRKTTTTDPSPAQTAEPTTTQAAGPETPPAGADAAPAAQAAPAG